MADVVVVGSLSIDFTATAARIPVLGETVMGDEFLMVPGGKGNNQALAAARQGTATAMIGCIGADELGDRIVASYETEGIDISHLERSREQPTGIAHIMVDAQGDNLIIVVPRANAELSPAAIGAHRDVISNAHVLLTQLEIPIDTVETALGVARTGGTTTILNPAPARDLTDELLGLVDILVPNETEAAALVGRPVEGANDAADAGRRLLDRGCRAVVVTLGEQGAVYVDTDRRVDIPAHRVDAVDTTAAGDAFCGTLAAVLARGDDLEVALGRAAAAGALAVTVPGASTAIPGRAAVEALAASGN